MGRKRVCASWKVAVKEIEDVLRNELKIEGLEKVDIVGDGWGGFDHIHITVDGRVLHNGVKWDQVGRRFDWYRGCDSLVWGRSISFEKRLIDYLNEKDRSILLSRGWGGKKNLIVMSSTGSLDWMYNIMVDREVTFLDLTNED